MIILSAVDRRHAQAVQARGVTFECFGNLNRQLARRRQDEDLRTNLSEINPLQQRHGEGGRLAGAGLGLAQNIATLQQRRDRASLNRRGDCVAGAHDRFQQRGVQTQVGKVQFRRRFDVGFGRGIIKHLWQPDCKRTLVKSVPSANDVATKGRAAIERRIGVRSVSGNARNRLGTVDRTRQVLFRSVSCRSTKRSTRGPFRRGTI